MDEDRIKAFYKEFGRRLRHHRRKLKLSQAELAEPLGLNRTSIYNLEKGQQQLPVHLLRELARLLDVKEEELLPWKKLKEDPLDLDARMQRVKQKVDEEYESPFEKILMRIKEKEQEP